MSKIKHNRLSVSGTNGTSREAPPARSRVLQTIIHCNPRIQKYLHNSINRILIFLKDPHVFIAHLIVTTALLTFLCSRFIIWEHGNMLYPFLWMIGFCVLSFDLVSNVTCAVIYCFTKPLILKEKKLTTVPACAIVYPVRNEAVGLYERMEYTIKNNNLPSMTFCFLSDSSPEFFPYESDVVKKLRARFKNTKIFYRHRARPEHAKPGNIKEWLHNHHSEFKYFFVCDADSLLPKNALIKLLQKAEHPENERIAIFQTRIDVAHAKTLFSLYQSWGVYISQRLYANVKQRIFKCALSFGHGNLIRMDAFMKITVPSWALSHDIWDMALLSKKGYKTVFCSDVISYEEVPPNYIEMRTRDRRWIKGNMQSISLLFDKDLPVGARFYVFYGIFMYLCQPAFLAWIMFSLLGNTTLFGQYLYFVPLIGSGPNPFYFEVYYFTVIVFAAVFCHKFLICRSFKDFLIISQEIIASTLISLNNIVYQSIDLFFIVFQKIAWIPMKKDPYKTLTFTHTIKILLPGTVLGISMSFFLFTFCPPVTFLVLPILVCLSLSIPIVYVTSLPWIH